MPSLAGAITGQVQGYQEAERRRVIDEIQTRFADLDPTNFDAFFKMAEEYNIPGFSLAMQDDFVKGLTPGSIDSVTRALIEGVELPPGFWERAREPDQPYGTTTRWP